MDVLKKEVPSQRIVLILESCYSGAAELTSGSKSLFGVRYNLDLDKVSLGKGFIILSSSQPDQITWSNSFSENLIKALRANDGMSNLNDAFEKAKEGTESDTKNMSNGQRCQTPIMKSDWHGKPLLLGVPPLSHIAPIPSNVGIFLAAESSYLKANQALIAGNLDEALTHYKDALSVDPNYADAWADYGSALSLKSQYPEALDAYRKAILLKPADALFHLNYARLLAKSDHWQGSVSELNESLRLDPKNRTTLVALANVKIQAGEYGQAADYLKRAIVLYPGAASLHDRLAYVLGRDGASTQAIEESRKAVELDPKLLSAHLNLAANILLSGDSAGALLAYQDALKLDPDNADAHYCAGQILKKKGETAKANDELKKFLDVAKVDDPRRSEVQVQFDGAVGTIK
jgi:tetratricopeptide (TPR) repeat protein